MAVHETGRSSSKQSSSSAFSLQWDPAQTENVLNFQQTILDSYQHAGQMWFDRLQSEISLWSDLATKLAGTRTLPEVFDACSKSFSRRAQMVMGDSNKLVDETQQMMQKMAQSLQSIRPQEK